ncbi:MAG TPA: alkaline phosphatase D family protein [Chitinophagales bacterium]|jgi:hypothetical protein|nr:alkaline phosphatase D family protein [Chitinophagales bacterium]HQV77364.1 alkaline phosphatase D family protein [Chitinophagales bacterium]HQW78426.1 alkaline phosphatase D family protein [Chitinophagales bacterium]
MRNEFFIKRHFFVVIVILFLCKFNTFSQSIIGVPIVGAVTSNSCKLLYFTDFSSVSEVNIFSDQNDTFVINNIISDSIYFVSKLEINTLKSNTVYTLLIKINGIPIARNTFKTFPDSNLSIPFSFTFGSCTEQHFNDSIFIEIKKQDPLFFLHLGDWLYANNFNESKFYYTQSLQHQKELYTKRYEMPNLKNLLKSTSIDFVFDDEDGVFDDFSKNTYSILNNENNKIKIIEVAYPDSLRETVINGMHTFFPSYSNINNKAYHSFLCGNSEFFFLDTRSTRSPNTESFFLKDNYYTYKVPNNHTILDDEQLDWLLNGLKKSTAQWKFIVSGVTFNKSYKKILDIALLKRVQNRKLPNGMTGVYVAASLSSMWFAFPETQAAVLNFCHDNKIKNVLVLSGDAHTAAIDDGTNAGFPELMAGGLAQKNSRLAAIIYNNLQMNVWNKGGQGIQNSNFNDAFGKVEINGNKSVNLSCIDKYGNVICSYELKDGFIPEKIKIKKYKSITLGSKIKAAKQALKIKNKM